jgi:hypothetical protein
MENNDVDAKINSSSYKFFRENGTILDHSCCNNIQMKVMKPININKNDEKYINFIIDNNIDIPKVEKIKNDSCIALTINDSDVTVKERNKIVKRSQDFCDEGCSFISFNLDYKYSVCECRMLNEEDKEDNTIGEQINITITDSELLDKAMQMIEEGNLFKIIKCKHVISNNFFSSNWIKIFSFLFFLGYLASVICFFFIFKVFAKFKDIFIQERANIQIEDADNDDNDNDNNDDDENNNSYYEARRGRNNFCETYKKFLKQKLVMLIFFRNENNFNHNIFRIFKIMIYLENLFLLDALLFTDDFLYLINNNLENVVAFGFSRIVLIILLYPLINFIILFFFNSPNKLREAKDKFKNTERTEINKRDYSERLEYLSTEFKVKFIIGFILIFAINILITFYFLVFGNIISSKAQLNFLIFFILSFVGYHIAYAIIFFLITLMRCISLHVESDYLEEIFFNVSVWMADIF